MRFWVERLLTSQPIEGKTLLAWVNRELMPLIRSLRASHNDLAQYFSGSTSTEVIVDLPTGVAITVKYNGATRFKADATGISFYGLPTIAQQTGPGTLTDASTGTVGTAINDVGAAFSQATLNNNFATLTDRVNQMKLVLKHLGLTT